MVHNNTTDRSSVQPTSDGTCPLCGVKLRDLVAYRYGLAGSDGYECESCGRRWLWEEL